MSYILDALKKTEAERDPVAAANLALTQQRAYSLSRVAGIVVAVALLANAAVLIWLFGPTSNPPAPTAAAPAAAPAPVREIPQTSEPTVAAPITAPAAPAEPPTEITAQPTRRISIRLAELPASARARFPGLVFSTHIYADDANLRAVVANGQRLVEGDEISGTALERITEDGVILAFEDYLVEIPVVADWE